MGTDGYKLLEKGIKKNFTTMILTTSWYQRLANDCKKNGRP